MKSVWDAVRRSLEGVFVLSKRRIKFSKTGMGKYISHLDLLRTFTRSIMRSGLPVRYSQGFNPHQLITFSLPLPIGVTSICEYVDIDFEDTASDEEIYEKLNQNLPMDMRVLAVGPLIHKANAICAAEYRIELLTGQEIDAELLAEFFAADEIWVEKKTKKKGLVSVNLMEFIQGYTYREQTEDACVFEVVLCAGGEKNIKPEILTGTLVVSLGEKGIQIDGVNIERLQIFCTEDGKMVNFC